MMIIERPLETEKVSRTKKWVLVYGRRKTGKTFLVKNFVKYDEYFFVKRDGTIISEEGDKSVVYDTFIEIVKRSLSGNKTVVVDEFHRLGEDFFDFLHYTKKQGKLILISSTLFLSRKLFSGRSALLGLLAEIPISLISLGDCIRALKKSRLSKKHLLELAMFFREPITIEYFDENTTGRKIIREVLETSVRTIPALVGEIFVEEERHISAIYEGVLRAIANGKVVSGEISSYLFSRRLIKKDDPSIIQQYLNNLTGFGIIRKIEVYGKKRFIYKHVSPLAKLFYYADEKYNISERKPGEGETGRIIDSLIPHLVEDTMREFFAEKFSLKETVVQATDYDVDACLLKFKKPEVSLEVKWKGKTARDEIRKAENNLERTDAKRKILFVQDKKGLFSDKIEILDVSDL